MSAVESERWVEPDIPSRRIAAKDHLARAAKAPVDSNAEHYHLAAAQAEALVEIGATLQELLHELRVWPVR